MFTWPKLELTDYERKWVRPYKTATHAGVLKRTYERTISNNPAIAAKPGIQPSEQLQISRRSRVFALSFAGGLSATRLQITNASGTLYNVRDPRTAKFGYVTSMVGGSCYMQGSVIGRKGAPQAQGTNLAPVAPTQLYSSGEAGVLLIDPNWVLVPNETLIFNGDWSDLPDPASAGPTIVLDITVHTWEFPGMGIADKAVREVL